MEERNSVIRKIAITGPESSGKTMLASSLSEHYGTKWVPEYARSYQLANGVDNSLPVISMLARQQFKAESNALIDAHHYLFCDTDAMNFIVWLDYFHYEIPPFIANQLRTYQLFLLMRPDLPWVSDGLRRNEHDREILFSRFEQFLKQHQLPYQVISGHGINRKHAAIEAIDRYFSNT